MAMAAKDDMIELFRERFTGHELDAPPGAWEAIQGQLAQAASAEGLREALQDKFNGHELDVDPGVWQQISSQLGHGAAATGTTGQATTWGWVAAAAGVVAIVATLYYTDQGPTAVVPTPVTPQGVPVVPIDAEPSGGVAPAVMEEHKPVAEVSLPATTPKSKLVAKAQQQEEEPGMEVVRRILRDLEQNTPVAVVPVPVPSPAPLESRTQPGRSTSPDTPSPNSTIMDPPEDQGPPAEVLNTTVVVEPTILIPNIFTPNNDGVNDQLEVRGRDFDRVVVKIFSAQTNALVFQANGLGRSWDGRLPDGQLAENGLYFYACEVFTKDGRVFPKGEVIKLER